MSKKINNFFNKILLKVTFIINKKKYLIIEILNFFLFYRTRKNFLIKKPYFKRIHVVK